MYLVAEHYEEPVDLAQLPQDPVVYETLQRADTVGMFQVESRAQMASLPRNQPDKFYDLVVQVAIIRPGPIVGKMMHPYMRRRQKKEDVTYPHPSLVPVLKRTLGVPLFQEQLLRMAMTVADFSGCGSRRIAPCRRHAPLLAAHGAAGREAAQWHDGEWPGCSNPGQHYSEHYFVRAVWLS